MKSIYKFILFSALAAAGCSSSSSSSSSSENESLLGKSCKTTLECKSETLVCHPDVKVCIERCDAFSCDPGKLCSDDGICFTPECSESKNCADVYKVCRANSCVDPGTCTKNDDCSLAEPLCRNSKCVAISDIVCTSDFECGEGLICDNRKCIPEDSCSDTRRCEDETGNTVCRNGKCVKTAPPQCSVSNPCPNSDTCVAGKCVSCSCNENEVCQADGTCTNLNHSNLNDVMVGDECKTSNFKTFCDGNRLFTCSQTIGQESEPHVKVRDCKANICATSPTDGTNCYEPCVSEGDFYGECLGDYHSDTGATVDLLFTTMCTKSKEGPLIWTFTEGVKTCASVCKNGTCLYTPDSIGQSCSSASFADRCQGNWWLECVEENPQYAGFVSGFECSISYGKDYRCVEDLNGLLDCATPCTQENKQTAACRQYAGGRVYSEVYICQKAKDGHLYNITSDYEECSNGCDSQTGYCKE